MKGMVIGKDIFDVTPPTSFSIFIPGIVLARMFDLSSEAGVYIITYIIFCLSFSVFLFVDNKAKILKDSDKYIFYIFYVFLFIVYYQDVFAQREHYAVILMMPYFALIASYINNTNNNISNPVKYIIGAMMGIASVIKPFFVFPVFCVVLYYIYRTKDLKIIFKVENFVLAFVAIGYFLITYFYYIDYFTFFKNELLGFYSIDHMYMYIVIRLSHSISYLLLLFIVSFMKYKTPFNKDRSIERVLFVASLGFYVVYLAQRKGYPYHIYPAFVLLFLCFAIHCGHALSYMISINKSRMNIGLTIIGVIFFSVFTLTEAFTTLRFVPSTYDAEQAVMKIKKHPKILSMTRDIAQGHPLARNVKGEWVGSYPDLWGFRFVLQDTELLLILRDNYDDLPPQQRRLFELRKRVSQNQLKVMARDISERKPDIIILAKNEIWNQFVFSDPDIEAAMKNYEHATDVDFIELWKRKN